MKPFPVATFLDMVRSFQKVISDPRSASDKPLEGEDAKAVITGANRYAIQAKQCGLASTSDQYVRISSQVRAGCAAAELNRLIEEVMNRLEDDCRRKLVMAIESGYECYFKDAQFFDPKDPHANKVSVQFPSAAEDIAESGKCLACGRPTACVMHLNRVMEAGLKALATACGVGAQNDWGKYLEGIDKELQKRLKASGARTADEQFYAEAHAMFDSVRRAWRNPTMHVDKTYTEERAEEILIAVRSFMRHLATKLHD